VQRARKVERFLSQPMFVAERFTGRPGKYVPVAETVKSFARLLAGEADHVPEQFFFTQGTLDDVITEYEASQAKAV